MSDSQSSKQNADSRPWHCHACNCFNARTNLKCVLCGVERLPHETNGVTDEQAFTAAAVRALRGHRWCGDQYPENGWPDINTALALYAKLGRSPLEPSPEPCKHGHTNQGCRECFPLKASGERCKHGNAAASCGRCLDSL